MKRSASRAAAAPVRVSEDVHGCASLTPPFPYSSHHSQVVSRRDRLAIPIKAGMTNAVPGCVILDTSSTGATLFVEPPEAVELNNLQQELEVAEADEEARVLKELTERVRRKKTALRVVMRALAVRDRARPFLDPLQKTPI